MGESRKPKQGKLSIELYNAKAYFLVDPEPSYDWFISGHSPREQHSVAGWAADKGLQGKPVPNNATMEYLRIKRR